MNMMIKGQVYSIVFAEYTTIRQRIVDTVMINNLIMIIT